MLDVFYCDFLYRHFSVSKTVTSHEINSWGLDSVPRIWLSNYYTVRATRPIESKEDKGFSKKPSYRCFVDILTSGNSEVQIWQECEERWVFTDAVGKQNKTVV